MVLISLSLSLSLSLMCTTSREPLSLCHLIFVLLHALSNMSFSNVKCHFGWTISYVPFVNCHSVCCISHVSIAILQRPFYKFHFVCAISHASIQTCHFVWAISCVEPKSCYFMRDFLYPTRAKPLLLDTDDSCTCTVTLQNCTLGKKPWQSMIWNVFCRFLNHF